MSECRREVGTDGLWVVFTDVALLHPPTHIHTYRSSSPGPGRTLPSVMNDGLHVHVHTHKNVQMFMQTNTHTKERMITCELKWCLITITNTHECKWSKTAFYPLCCSLYAHHSLPEKERSKRQRQRGDDTTESILNQAMHIQTHTQHTTGRQ